MITVKGLTKKFSANTAINGISFSVKEGEIVGFLGPNGAGKTTTMRLLLGYLAPTAGSITINSLDPQEKRMAVLKETGYLPENNPLYSDMRVNEYLEFIAEIKEADNVRQIYEEVGLDEVLNKKIEELSRGFKQRVGLAAALLGDPKILILDEPTSGLDPIEQDKIRDLIKSLANPPSLKLRRARKTIIFSTHILSEAEDVATRLIIINRGKIVYDGKKSKGKGGVEKLFKKYVKSI